MKDYIDNFLKEDYISRFLNQDPTIKRVMTNERLLGKSRFTTILRNLVGELYDLKLQLNLTDNDVLTEFRGITEQDFYQRRINNLLKK